MGGKPITLRRVFGKSTSTQRVGATSALKKTLPVVTQFPISSDWNLDSTEDTFTRPLYTYDKGRVQTAYKVVNRYTAWGKMNFQLHSTNARINKNIPTQTHTQPLAAQPHKQKHPRLYVYMSAFLSAQMYTDSLFPPQRIGPSTCPHKFLPKNLIFEYFGNPFVRLAPPAAVPKAPTSSTTRKRASPGFFLGPTHGV